ncbi:MAG TPA: transcriptional regulator GcvA [Paucimonas sp.]|nr:transcriptional regulator GcvA [Paucimonas sp.]
MADLRRLPNLAALRAFEAAARHENFSRAAEEIHVTHGAISHQVRALEEELGVALFARHGKRLSVTADGERFAAAVRKALSDIALAADAVKSGARQKRLTITALASFAARCLAPRLGNFIEQHPDIEVALQSNNHLTDFTREEVDVGVRFGSGQYPNLHTELLMHDYYYPVASPGFNGGRLPRCVRELAGTELLRTAGEPWKPWFAAAGVDDFPEPHSRLTFYDSSLPVRAALDGEGIALVRHSLVARDVRDGRLVRLFDTVLDCEYAYYFVCLPSALQKPSVQVFRTWLIAEMEALKFDAMRAP